MARLKREQFRFRRHDRIGAEGAEEDSEFLFDCFVDTGDIDILADTTSAQRIVIGRTGSGKSALLLMLRERQENVAWLEPEKLALQYIANSTIIRRLTELDINLDIFYRLLWRHIFAVELIRLKYNVRSDSDQKRFLERIRQVFSSDRRRNAALDYLIQWGEHFWEDTEYRIHEVTSKLEREVKASLGADFDLISGQIGGSGKRSDEERKELTHRLQEIVNSVQIRQLGEVIEALAEDVFVDPQERYYVIIDQLDEKWVDDPLRYQLVRALIETVRDLRKISAAKVIVAIRKDLLDRVFRETRDSGFQEEKYQPLLLRIYWRRAQLLQVVDRRLNELVRRRYTKGSISWQDILPRRVGKTDTAEYIINRTMYRPRDVIQFINCCISIAVDRPDISASIVRSAESDYSTLRFRSLQDEWIADYPNLLRFASLLKKAPPVFSANAIDSERLDMILAGNPPESDSDGPLIRWAHMMYRNEIDFDELRRRIIKVFYQVGLVGIRPESGAAVSWSFLQKDVLREAEISASAKLSICPMFYRVLGTHLNR